MKFNTKEISHLLITVYSSIICFGLSLDCPADNTSAVQKMAGYIAEYNTEQIRLSDINDTYRGEEGILFIKPDEAVKLGLKVYTDQDYNDALSLFKKAADALEAAEKALSYRGSREPEHDVTQKIITNILTYKENSLLAKGKLVNYRKNLIKDQDDRFNHETCNRIISTFLEEGLQKTGNNLRDALAYFYNKIHGIKQNRLHINTENVRYVNHIYNSYMALSSPDEIAFLDTDRNLRNGSNAGCENWQAIVKEELPALLPHLEAAVQKTGNSIYRTDPLLFLALIKQESSFKPKAVSVVGAAGLTQLMPQTALDLGLKNIYMPEYFKKAGELSKKERELRAKARERLLSITTEEDIQAAKEARQHMLKSLETGDKRKELQARYKKDLINHSNDDRFDPSKAIEAGYAYFSRHMKSHNGDISLALASYNAGSHRVKEYNGLPPFRETIGFRNSILQYYRDYLSRIAN